MTLFTIFPLVVVIILVAAATTNLVFAQIDSKEQQRNTDQLFVERTYNLTKNRTVTTGALTPEMLLHNNITNPVNFPQDNHAMVIVTGSSWFGTITEGDGDTSSYDAIGADIIEFPCAPGEEYTVSLQKDESSNNRFQIAIITNDEILDIGETFAAYGGVSLSGTC